VAWCVQRARTMRNIHRTFAIAITFSFAAGCVTDGDTTDDDTVTSSQIQELNGNNPLSYPFVRQNTPLGAWVYEQAGKGWLRWAMGLPWSTGPINDTDGSQCALAQSGPIWFLAGTSYELPTATRSCDIPFGKALFFPMINTWITPPPPFITPTEDEAYWTAFSEELLPIVRGETCSLTLRLDGRELPRPPLDRENETYTDILDPFPVLFNDDNYTYGAYEGGIWPLAYMGGNFALLLPLLPGDHVLEFGGALCDQATGEVYFSTAVTWNLHVH
jgi:hypothetical protein